MSDWTGNPELSGETGDQQPIKQIATNNRPAGAGEGGETP